MDRKRYLIVTADDFGIGPATSQGILDLAAEGLLTGTVLLVTSPYAPEAVSAWRRSGEPVELGWHPCLTLDCPVAPPQQVPSLVDRQGNFWPLGSFLRRLWLGQVRAADIETELRAQYQRFHDLVRRPPFLINAHHHIQVFAPVGAILRAILADQRVRPYLRRVVEPRQTLCRVPGARLKRFVLTWHGRSEARSQAREGLPGNDWLVGITNPECVADPEFLNRWLDHVPGTVVELTCHPGHLDPLLIGRDCPRNDAQLQRRSYEFNLIRQPSFAQSCRRGGFERVRPEALRTLFTANSARAA